MSGSKHFPQVTYEICWLTITFITFSQPGNVYNWTMHQRSHLNISGIKYRQLICLCFGFTLFWEVRYVAGSVWSRREASPTGLLDSLGTYQESRFVGMGDVTYAVPLISPCFYTIKLYVCEIWGFRGGDDDDTGFGAFYTRRCMPPFPRYILPASDFSVVHSSSSIVRVVSFGRSDGKRPKYRLGVNLK
jgi:hypothetical protein